jgi:hypothetical protein
MYAKIYRYTQIYRSYEHCKITQSTTMFNNSIKIDFMEQPKD